MFFLESSGAKKEGFDSSKATHLWPTRTRPEMGAEDSEKIIPSPQAREMMSRMVGPLELYDQAVAQKMPEGPFQTVGSKNLVAGTIGLSGNISVENMVRSVKDPALENTQGSTKDPRLTKFTWTDGQAGEFRSSPNEGLYEKITLFATADKMTSTDKAPRPIRTAWTDRHVGESKSSPNEGLSENIALSSVDDNMTTTDKDPRPVRTSDVDGQKVRDRSSPNEGLYENISQLTAAVEGRGSDVTDHPGGRSPGRSARKRRRRCRGSRWSWMDGCTT